MPTPLDRSRVSQCLRAFDLETLFVEELGWDRGGADTEVAVDDRTFLLEAIAHKRGLVAYQHVAVSDDAFPDYPTRRKIEKSVAKTVHEHIIIYAAHDINAQCWQWVKREPGRPDRMRQHIYHRGQSGEALAQRLEQIAFTLAEEDDLTIVNVSGRVRAAFDVEKVTKKFYERFKKEHRAFLGFIEGIENVADREWYASLMLNRMMFIYFIQKRGFLDGDTDYLRNRLKRVQADHGDDRFQSFYRLFLLKLFHQGLGQPEADRSPELAALLGQVPYLNGGLFDVHDLERDNSEIQIPDTAFEKIFAFFDAYQWHLDDRPLHNDNEINPDVLGYIFEKYINQKQMGAYYTKEDITGYISRNTTIPFLFDQARKHCPIAFGPGGGVWSLLSDDPDKYFYEAVRHGITYDIYEREPLAEKRELPTEIAGGLNDVSHRGGWNKPAPFEYGLPTETWREHVARRQRYQEIHAKLAAGEVASINDLITYNLDIEKFAQDVIAGSEGPELIRAFWKALERVSILDPACGSGAFLFAALNILEPIYTACLEAMQGLLDDLKRSKRKHRPEKMSDFRKVLEQVRAHASERYFVLKSIMVNNLYGVDIMEEAVEICKLRLFLKLVAQLDSYEQIEPLPDIDFNVRAGNTLVGFTSLREIRKAFTKPVGGQGRMIYGEEEEELGRIEEDAEIADRAFRKFREMQTRQNMDASEFSNAKAELRKRLDRLRDELDRYLAGEYGIKTDNQTAYEGWRDSHQPFHWFVEFYGIMRNDGFDVIVGNPPYVEYSKVRKTYQVKDFSTKRCGNLYALCTERCLDLLGTNRRFGFIVQAPIVSTQRMSPLRALIHKRSNFNSYATFDDRPSKLFQGMDHCRVCIVLSRTSKSDRQGFQTATTRYHKWYKEESQILLETVQYEPFLVSVPSAAIPKLRSGTELSIYEKIFNQPKTLGSVLSTVPTKNRIYYKITGIGHWFTFTTSPPRFWRDGVEGSSTRENSVCFANALLRDTVFCCLWSTLHYWLYQARTNCRDFNPSDLESIPIPSSVANGVIQFQQLARRIVQQLDQTSTIANATYNIGGQVSYQRFSPKLAKPIIDEIDSVLARHYGFTDEELDFIINYDIKYRMGREAVGSGV